MQKEIVRDEWRGEEQLSEGEGGGDPTEGGGGEEDEGEGAMDTPCKKAQKEDQT